MTESLIKSCKKKSKLLKKYKKFPSVVNKVRYKQYKNLLKILIRKTEREYYSNKLLKVTLNIRNTWKVINSIINNSPSRDKINNLKLDNLLLTDRKDIVHELNKYFVNIGPNLSNCIPSSVNQFDYYLNSPNIKSMALIPTDEYEIIKIINKLKQTSSSGVDDIPSTVIKCAAKSIAKALALMINNSMNFGIFPSPLKIAKITPIFKGGSSILMTNYRPISILPVLSKIYEKVIATRLNSFLEKNKIKNDKQFGFRKNHSTALALTKFMEYITEKLDNGNLVLSVFVDLSKAFDTIDHKILIKKLFNYGIRGTALKLFEDYLTNRYQCVAIGDNISSLLQITCGVPQGSILGPVLFILYINDLSNCVKVVQILLFADDTTIYLASKDINNLCQEINNELKKLSD